MPTFTKTRALVAALPSALLIVAALSAQDSRDLSGHWGLVQPTASQLAEETLAVTAATELFITHTPRDITITHSPQPGATHPETGTFQYGSGGFVGDSGSATPLRGTWGVSQIGTQLMMSRSTIYPPDKSGTSVTIARGSMWRREGNDTLVIEFGEERPGERPKIATRVYSRLPWQ